MTLGQWHAGSNRLARGLGQHGVAPRRPCRPADRRPRASRVADLVHGHPQGGRGGRPVAVATRRRRAGAHPAPCRCGGRPVQRRHRRRARRRPPRGLDGGERRRELARAVVAGRQRPADRVGPRRRGGRHVHLGHHRGAERRRRAPRRAGHRGPGPRTLARPRVPFLVSLRHDQRLAPGLRTPARRVERLVPPPLRSRTVDRHGRAGPSGGRLLGPRHGGTPRRLTPLRRGGPLELGRGERRQRADRPGDVAALRARGSGAPRSSAGTA